MILSLDSETLKASQEMAKTMLEILAEDDEGNEQGGNMGNG
ncbi:hypothetical protein [Bacillus pseudomycoides]|nr:hypothetical protein [Bacillus pseudomycoides]